MDIGPIIVMNTKLLLGVIITPSNNFVFIKSVLSRTCLPSLCNYQSCMVMISIVSWGIVAQGSWCQPHSQGPPTPPSGARETGKRGPWELGSSRSRTTLLVANNTKEHCHLASPSQLFLGLSHNTPPQALCDEHKNGCEGDYVTCF